MDPASLVILIASIGTLILNVFQSIKSGHFKSSCLGCCELTHDIEGQPLKE